MQNYLKIFKKIFPEKKSVYSALIFGFSISAAIYLGLLQRHFFSWRYLFYSILIFISGTLFAGWLIRFYIQPGYIKFPKKIRIFIFLASLLFSLILLFNTEIQPTYYLLPDSNLEMRFSIPELDPDQEGVRLLWVETGQGYVHYTNMEISGEWERVFGNTIFAPDQSIVLTWQGKAGAWAEIAFRHTDFDQQVDVIWNGKKESISLLNPKEPDIFIRNRFDVPLIYQIPFILAFIISVGFGLFSMLVLLGSLEPRNQPADKGWAWLRYMLPMLAVWGLTLLIFWPGIMSSDALSQWAQGYLRQFDDWHSAMHSILLSVLMRVWYSPAFISIIQILLLSFIVAWGLKTLGERGISKVVLWSISILFAIFPPNGIFVITLWKDIPYAITFLWFTIMMVNISLTRGKWAEHPLHWMILGLSAGLVAVFRQNGAGISLISLLPLPLIFKKYWKQLGYSLLLAIVLYAGIKGPLYTAVNINRGRSGQTNLIFLHHITAHLEAGTELFEEESQYLNSFMPLDDWEYWCCYVGTISYDNDFGRQDFLANTTKNRDLALKLFSRNPLVDISHTTCAGELSWKFENNQCYMKSTHGINSWSPGTVDWIGGNDYHLEDKSVFPGLVDKYVSWLRNFGFLDDELVPYLRPAFWLYLAIFAVTIFILRSGNFYMITSLLPILSQAMILLLVSYAPAYRYHYGTCLAGIFLLGLAFLPGNEESVRSKKIKKD